MAKLLDMSTVKEYPGLSLEHFGTNPFGKSRFRVVWSESRTYIAGMRHQSGTVDMKSLPLYPGFHGWVIERWLPALQSAGTRQQYEFEEMQSGVSLGPYPSEGMYFGCAELSAELANASVIETRIQMILASEKTSFNDNKVAMLAAEEKKEKAWLDRAGEIYKESQGPFGHNPVAGIPGKKKPEDMKIDISADDLGLNNKKDGAFFAH